MVLIIVIWGLIVGSFITVLVDRLPRGENPLLGRSHCDFCKRTLQWYDLIPVISFVILNGKCRYCNKFIGWKYIIIEITTALMYAFASYIFLNNNNIFSLIALGKLLYLLIITSCFLVIFFCDLFYGMIPDVIVLPASVVSFSYTFVTSFHNLPTVLLSALGAFFFFFFLFAITNGKGMGFGDVKLAFLIGLTVGWPGTFLSIYLAFLTGAFVAFILILWGKKKFYAGTIPFGPFLVIGTFVSLFFGNMIMQKIIAMYF